MTTYSDKPISDRLAALRHEKGLSQEKIAVAMGLSRAAVGHMETDSRSLKWCRVAEYAKACGSTAVVVFGATPDAEDVASLNGQLPSIDKIQRLSAILKQWYKLPPDVREQMRRAILDFFESPEDKQRITASVIRAICSP